MSTFSLVISANSSNLFRMELIFKSASYVVEIVFSKFAQFKFGSRFIFSSSTFIQGRLIRGNMQFKLLRCLNKFLAKKEIIFLLRCNFFSRWFEPKYSRVVLVKFVEDSFLKAVFHKFYLVHSWILCPICIYILIVFSFKGAL